MHAFLRLNCGQITLFYDYLSFYSELLRKYTLQTHTHESFNYPHRAPPPLTFNLFDYEIPGHYHPSVINEKSPPPHDFHSTDSAVDRGQTRGTLLIYIYIHRKRNAFSAIDQKVKKKLL